MDVGWLDTRRIMRENESIATLSWSRFHTILMKVVGFGWIMIVEDFFRPRDDFLVEWIPSNSVTIMWLENSTFRSW